MQGRALSAVLLALLTSGPAYATIITLEAQLSGANEVVPPGGDLDGSGLATLMIDDVALTVTWEITVEGIGAPVAAHIHEGPAGVNGPIQVDFSGLLSGGPLQDDDLAGVLANPAGWYVNVHTEEFQGGAIRGQLSRVSVPVSEPGSLALLGLGLLGLGLTRRRAN